MTQAINDLRYFIDKVNNFEEELTQARRQRNLMALALMTAGGYPLDINEWNVDGVAITSDNRSAIVYLESVGYPEAFMRVLINERGEASEMD